MALITRISRLFKADFHAVLDQIEEPELLLRQAIREMEDDLAAREQRIRLTGHEQESLRARAAELSQSQAELDEQLDLCFTAQKPELARNLVRRKLESQRAAQQLARREAANEKFLSEQRATLEEHRITLDGLRQKAEIFASRSREPAGDFRDSLDRAQSVSDDEVEVAFLREQTRRAAS